MCEWCNESVAAKLRRRYPWLLYIHCAAHRLNLIVAAYFRKVTEANNVINVYKSLHAIFNVASHREIFDCSKGMLSQTAYNGSLLSYRSPMGL